MKPLKKKKVPTALPFKERVAGYLRDEQKLLDKYEIDRDLIILFKKKSRLGRFGAWIIWKSRGYLDIRFRDRIEPPINSRKKSRANS